MATINGLQIKGLKFFIGHEGECYQGNLYLNNKKIGFWSQDSWGGIIDNVNLERDYSETYLRKQIIALNEDKTIKGKSTSGVDYTINYDFERLMTDLLILIDNEKAFKKAIKSGYVMTLVVSDGFCVSTWSLPSKYISLSDDEVQKVLAKDIEKAKAKMFNKEEITVKVYRSLDDFIVGKKISLEDIKR